VTDGREDFAEPDIPRVPSDDCLLYRLIRPDWVMPDGGRPKSQAFSDHPADGALSMFLSDEMEAAGKTVADLGKLWPGYRVCWITVGQVCALGQEVVRDPIEQFPGHAAVRDRSGRRSAGTRARLAKAVKWCE
jgi:hypothetical protein